MVDGSPLMGSMGEAAPTESLQWEKGVQVPCITERLLLAVDSFCIYRNSKLAPQWRGISHTTPLCPACGCIWQRLSNLPHDRETSRQKYTRVLILAWTPKIHSNILPTPPISFTGGGVTQFQNLAQIFDTSRLWRTVASRRRHLSETQYLHLQRRWSSFVLTRILCPPSPNLASFWISEHCNSETKQRTWLLTEIRAASTRDVCSSEFGVVRFPSLRKWGDYAAPIKFVSWKCVKSPSSRSGPVLKLIRDWIISWAWNYD